MPDALTPIYGPDLGLSANRAILGRFGRVPQTLAMIGPSAAVTAIATEAAFSSLIIPPNFLEVGSVVRIRWQGIATATNSTDTLAVKAYIGGLSGTLLFTHAATDVANDNVFSGEYEVHIRTAGATGTMAGFGWGKSIPAAEGTMSIKDDILASTTVDTTAALSVAISGTWSSNNAGNSARLDVFSVTVA